MRTLAIDIETYSKLDITKTGIYKYAEDCEMILLAYAFDDEPVEIIDLALGEKIPQSLVDALYSPRVLKTAYNAAFEITVLENYFGRPMDSLQWHCTMVLGLSLGLPAGLGSVGRVLKLDFDKRKLAEGKKLVQHFSRPCSEAEAKIRAQDLSRTDNPYRTTPYDDWDKWLEFKTYCKQDVEAERAIRHELEKFKPTGTERRLWKLDRDINRNGVWVDMELVQGAIKVTEALKSEALERGKELTGGLNPNSIKQMLNWMEQKEGRPFQSLNKSARAELLEEDITPEVREFLLLKDILAKVSVRKYQTMNDTICYDNRARGMFQFYGANRTGRWSGRHIQLQNLPQNHMDDLDIARQFVCRGNYIALQLFYENPIEVLSQLIRTAFVAAEGCRLIVADFSAIEARVLSWLADEKWRLDVFAKGGDIYCASASAMFGVPVEKHGVNKELRAKGKLAELACGYGGGIDALKSFGADKLGLSDFEIKNIVSDWRRANPNICKFWHIIESCAKKVVREKSKKVCRKGIIFECKDDFLFVTLPTGRAIAYYKPQIAQDFKTGREYLTYEGNSSMGSGWGVNSTWGGKIVENIVQAIARDCLAAAMLKLDMFGYKIIMHVHDEVILEMPEGKGSLEEVLSIMRKPLSWAKGLSLDAEGFETKYYCKN